MPIGRVETIAAFIGVDIDPRHPAGVVLFTPHDRIALTTDALAQHIKHCQEALTFVQQKPY